MPEPSSKQSTNVRLSLLQQATVAGIRVLESAWPSGAAEAGAWLFFRTQRRTPRQRGPRLPPSREISLVHRGRKLVGWQWGERGPLVLLVHGWNGRISQLHGFVPELVERGHRVVGFDLVGHGASSGSAANAVELAEDLLAIGDLVGPLGGVIAHSLGCAATSLALLGGLDAGRAVFLAPPRSPRAWVTNFSDLLRLRGETRSALDAAIRRRVGIGVDALDAEWLGQFQRAELLVIHDEDDREVPLADGRAVAARWPDADLEITRGLGHRRILRDPGVIARVAAYLAREPRARVAPALPVRSALRDPHLEDWARRAIGTVPAPQSRVLRALEALTGPSGSAS